MCLHLGHTDRFIACVLSRHWVFLAIIGGMEDSYSSEIVVWCVGTGICVGILVVCCKV